jgi:hypothetical protein
MKKIVGVVSMLLLCGGAFGQRKCGAEQLKNNLVNRHPEAAEMLEQQRGGMQAIADAYRAQMAAAGAQRTTAASAVPVVFHIIVDSIEFKALGGIAGIERRCDSQIVVLNRDYNRANLDSGLIPTSWKALYGNVGIHFGLAHTDPLGMGTPGYEIAIIPGTTASPGGFPQGSTGDYGGCKHVSSSGLDAWDVDKYMNVWCLRFNDDPSLLGITSAKSLVTTGFIPANEQGICINYLALGKRSAPSDKFLATGYMTDYYDQGRTLTHEAGHFFEIWHTWGDDGGSCPWTGGRDDGIADTPPEANSKFYVPTFSIPGGTFIDSCHNNGTTAMQPIGVASLDFMNYVDDIAMQLFTPGQAAVMASKVAVGGENYTLTQHPELLLWPVGTGVAAGPAASSFSVFPNPATGIIYLAASAQAGELQRISICNITGAEVYSLEPKGRQQDIYSIDLSAMNKGIYVVRCNFATGSITRKILLQ